MLSGEATLVNIFFYVPSVEVPNLKGKALLIFFPFRANPFSERGLMCRKANRKLQGLKLLKSPQFSKVCFIRALHCFQQSFSHIAMVSGCGRELNAHF